MTPESLRDLLREGRAPVMVDVRSKREYDAGHVPGAVHIPFWRMRSLWREVPAGRDEPVVVYCEHGPRAYLAGGVLKRRGFRAVSYLSGHMSRWRRLKLPLERS